MKNVALNLLFNQSTEIRKDVKVINPNKSSGPNVQELYLLNLTANFIELISLSIRTNIILTYILKH